MRKSTWHKHHKWSGLILCFFMLMFCLSGIVLNHREVVSQVNVSRGMLPPFYRFSNWNGGLLRGSIVLDDNSVLIYGAGGVWRTDSVAGIIEDYNNQLPHGADCRSIRSMVKMPSGEIFAVSSYGLFSLEKDDRWRQIKVPTDTEERLSDIIAFGDTLVIVGRSYLYLSTAPFVDFKRIELASSPNQDDKLTLFRTMWKLHSGELFGMPGRLVVDAIALVLIFLCLSGFVSWLLPKFRRYLGMKLKLLLGWSKKWHNKVGRATIVLTILLVITGWCLRPPLMIPLVMNKTKPIPGTSSPNVWHDKLRMLRYDDVEGDWILFTSDGFFSLESLSAEPTKIEPAPSVSVMGLNVWQRDKDGQWLCGSFSGMSRWNRADETITDYYSGESLIGKSGSPFGAKAISGFSSDLACGEVVVGYDSGTDLINQPESLAKLPMSLWNVALEVHSGRIYFGNSATYFFIFLIGGLALWCLWSGFKIRSRKIK